MGGKNFSDYKNVIAYDDYIIYQIDLDFIRKLILENNKQLWILDEKQIMNESSKEWIKYLTMPFWCDCIHDFYYIFPKLNKKFFITNYVYKAFKILRDLNDIQFYRNARNQEDREIFFIKYNVYNLYLHMKNIKKFYLK